MYNNQEITVVKLGSRTANNTDDQIFIHKLFNRYSSIGTPCTDTCN